ncbi:hypothetical protein [Anaerococcus provencensis]|uniref:hypothetical protein n=1 Tax=Anaerococcus provencensis TaxID=938293 RepID=UPI0002FDE9F8|nr:hypothetical protein [Anaerococcus provencensis]
MRKPIDRFSDKSNEEIYQKESLLEDDNLEKYDRLAMFLAAIKVLFPALLIVVGPILLFAILL